VDRPPWRRARIVQGIVGARAALIMTAIGLAVFPLLTDLLHHAQRLGSDSAAEEGS
jgi:hypothetical protein